MFDDGVISEWDLAKIRQYFNGGYPVGHGLYDEIFMPVYTGVLEQVIKDYQANKSAAKKSTTKPTAKEPKQTEKKSTDEDWDFEYEVPTEMLQQLLNVLSGIDAPKGKHEKPTVPATPPEVKKYMDDKTKISLTDKPKAKSTEKGKKERQSMTITKRTQTITITLTSGKTAVWSNDNYDNYKLVDGCFVILKNGVYVGIYNMRYVTSVIVEYVNS